MNLTDLLDRPIAYHRVFVTLTGSVKAAILLSQAMYWQKRAKQADGWWYKTADEWQDETGLTRHEQDTARAACSKYLKTDLRDAPARLYWHVEEGPLSADLLAESSQTSLAESGKLGSRFQANINRYAETTTETTTTRELSELDKAQANAKVDAILKPPPANHYQNRDKIPDPYLAYADTYHEVTGQEPTKRVLHEWLMTFSEWQSEGIQPEHIRAAYKAAETKFAVLRPGSLTNTAAALKAKGRGTRKAEEIDPAEWLRASKEMHAEAGG